jgi:exosome complex component CSL4
VLQLPPCASRRLSRGFVARLNHQITFAAEAAALDSTVYMSGKTAARPGDLVTPGMRVGKTSTHIPGVGVYASGDALLATLVGVLGETAGGGLPTVSVARTQLAAPPPLPDVGRAVTARVLKVTPRAAHVELLICDGVPLVDEFKGTIRQQDVRQTEVDKVDIYKCFRPGDVVAAEIISLGDRHSYFLTTAKNELGVVHANGPSGEPMLPISWQEMQCPKTKVRQPRKVAKRE